ncbi:MAG: hypothetical protein ACLVJZ_03665 [[Clostridium] leptum]
MADRGVFLRFFRRPTFYKLDQRIADKAAVRRLPVRCFDEMLRRIQPVCGIVLLHVFHGSFPEKGEMPEIKSGRTTGKEEVQSALFIAPAYDFRPAFIQVPGDSLDLDISADGCISVTPVGQHPFLFKRGIEFFQLHVFSSSCF